MYFKEQGSTVYEVTPEIQKAYTDAYRNNVYPTLYAEDTMGLGEAGLEDRRGKRKVNQEPRSEVEKLQIEIEKLKHQLYLTEIERDLLKKVRELEREDLYRK